MKQLFNILWCPEYGAKEHVIAALVVIALITVCAIAEALLARKLIDYAKPAPTAAIASTATCAKSWKC